MENGTFDKVLCENTVRTAPEMKQMKIILILECVFGIAAVFPNLLAIVVLLQAKIFHLNLRLLLAHLSFDLMFYSVAITQKAFRRLFSPVCDLPIIFRRCVLEDLPVMTPLHNAMFSLTILFVERLYATLYFRTYDITCSRPYMAIGLLTVSWLCTLAIQVTNYLSASPRVWIPVCDTNVVSHPAQLLPIFLTFLVLELTATGMIIFVYTYNRLLSRRIAINRALFNLCARFQVDQNVKMNAALLPSAVLHVICYMPNNMLLLLAFMEQTALAVEDKAWSLHVTFLWRQVYACAHPILLITLNPHLRQMLFKTIFGRAMLCVCHYCGKHPQHHPKVVAIGNERSVHFEYLDKVWERNQQNKSSGRRDASPSGVKGKNKEKGMTEKGITETKGMTEKKGVTVKKGMTEKNRQKQNDK